MIKLRAKTKSNTPFICSFTHSHATPGKKTITVARTPLAYSLIRSLAVCLFKRVYKASGARQSCSAGGWPARISH